MVPADQMRKQRVLFLSADQTLCESIALYLSEWYTASCVRSFENLEAQLREHGATLLLLDVSLSHEVVDRIKKIKESYPHVLIIITSIYSRATAPLENDLRPFVDRWFYKPFDLDEVKKSVDQLVASSRSQT